MEEPPSPSLGPSLCCSTIRCLSDTFNPRKWSKTSRACRCSTRCLLSKASSSLRAFPQLSFLCPEPGSHCPSEVVFGAGLAVSAGLGMFPTKREHFLNSSQTTARNSTLRTLRSAVQMSSVAEQFSRTRTAFGAMPGARSFAYAQTPLAGECVAKAGAFVGCHGTPSCYKPGSRVIVHVRVPAGQRLRPLSCCTGKDTAVEIAKILESAKCATGA